ncbi:hypothetical protein RF55_22902 [Lasius niger]|uniref:Uncharacterized protein n=1 Tax=Lasius niger TaxID=67767 RepID=A0A0J7JWI6_LASNI|nr:hypothetical protein RF55_22902 [Lasius niger]
MGPSTHKIYRGHLDRYEKWCAERDPGDAGVFRRYADLELRSRKLSRSYVKAVLNTIRRKWFSSSSRKKDDSNDDSDRSGSSSSSSRPVVRKRRATQKFTATELQKIRESCLVDYERNELSLWILLLTDTTLKTRDLPKLNGLEYRKKWIEGDDGYLSRFLSTVPNVPIFPKRHNTYLAQFKNRLEKLFPSSSSIIGGGKGNNNNEDTIVGSFEMIKRSTRLPSETKDKKKIE